MARKHDLPISVDSVEFLENDDISVPVTRSQDEPDRSFFRLQDERVGGGWTLPRYGVAWEPSDGGPVLETDVFVAVITLHCPKVKGCTAAFTFQSSRSASAGAKGSLTIVSAGVKLILTVRSQQAYETTDGVCVAIGFPAKLRMEWGTVKANGKPLLQCLRARFQDVQTNSESMQRLSNSNDACVTRPYQSDDLLTWGPDMRSLATKQKATHSYGAEITGELTLGLTLQAKDIPIPWVGAVPLKAEFESSASKKIAAGIDYTIVGGQAYKLYVPAAQPSWEPLWNVGVS